MTKSLKTIHSSTRFLRVSPRKLNLVAQLIRNMSPTEAMTQMKFCTKGCARYVLESLKTAVANAENNHNMRIKNLVISNASVGKAKCMKRHHPRAKGRSAAINKFFSNLYISLSLKE